MASIRAARRRCRRRRCCTPVPRWGSAYVAGPRRGRRAARPEAEAVTTMRRQICLQACITIPTLGATAALAKLCALLVAARALALAKLCARVAATALELLAASTSCGRFSSCVPHMTVESGCEGLGRQGLFSPTKSALPSKKIKPRFYFSYRFYFIKENYMFPKYSTLK